MKKQQKFKYLFDSSGLINLADHLHELPSMSYTISEVYEEISRKRNNLSFGISFKGTEKYKTLKAMQEIERFCSERFDIFIKEEQEPVLESLVELLPKQVAFELFMKTNGRIAVQQVDETGLGDFGREAGKIILDRIHKRQLYDYQDSDFPNYVMNMAREVQRIAYRVATSPRTEIKNPFFQTDISLVATARNSNVLRGSEVVIVSDDCDLEHLVKFSSPLNDRKVKVCKPHRLIKK